MKRNIFMIAILLLFVSTASSEEIDGKAIIIKAITSMDTGRYAETIEDLSAAYESLPVLGDYILFWLSKAYREIGDFTESNSKIRELLKIYPDSPLKKKARALEIKNIISSNESTHDLQVFESYTKDYPEDYEIKFLFAQLLKKQGKADQAKTLFKNIYINNNGMFSKMAYSELTTSDITLQELIEKATNLIDSMEFKDAESILRIAISKDNGQYKTDILKKLGMSLFRQKRYKESAEIYEKAGDYYSRAKALYRAGEKNSFNLTLKKLVSMKDRRAGSLLIWAASAKRREGQINEALNIYENVKSNYPYETESSLWGIGWTYYRNGNYQKAHDIFSELYNINSSTKYLYWKARSLEETGKDATNVYKELIGKAQDFYSILAYIKIRGESKIKNSAFTDQRFKGLEIQVPSHLCSSHISNPCISSERVNILIDLGMKKDAIVELSDMARKASSQNELLSIASRLHGEGEYSLALNLIAKLPHQERLHDILYPLAYWTTVRDASDKYGVDPFIILAVMREESRFDPDARSIAGALGLMQLMPETAHMIDRKINLNITSPEQLRDIKINISLGSYYLNSLIKDFGMLPAAIAAYNAGEDNVKKWQRAGDYKSYDEFIEDIPYDETRNYAKRVLTTYFEYLRYAGENDISRIL